MKNPRQRKAFDLPYSPVYRKSKTNYNNISKILYMRNTLFQEVEGGSHCSFLAHHRSHLEREREREYNISILHEQLNGKWSFTAPLTFLLSRAAVREKHINYINHLHSGYPVSITDRVEVTWCICACESYLFMLSEESTS